MQQQSPILSVFLQGASLESIANLIKADEPTTEGLLRAELHVIAAEHRAGNGQPEPQFLPAPKNGHAGDSRGALRSAIAGEIAAHKAKKERRAEFVEKLASPKTTSEDLSAYPEVLRDPRATRQRTAWAGLKGSPQTISELAHSIGVEEGAAYQAVMELRKKNLIVGSEETPVRWRIAAHV